MHKATAAWEQSCGVDFEHRVALDDKPGIDPEGLLFVVRAFDAGGKFIASSFFPSDPPERRRMLPPLCNVSVSSMLNQHGCASACCLELESARDRGRMTYLSRLKFPWVPCRMSGSSVAGV